MIVDGRAIAREITSGIKQKITKIRNGGGGINFAAVMVGENPASVVYVAHKQKACTAVGINMRTVNLPIDISQKNLEREIKKLSDDKNVHGILLQLPIPAGLDTYAAIENINPTKDVDGLTSANFGRLASGGRPVLVPCTAAGIMHVLKKCNVEVAGADVVVIGRSNIVGRPVAMMLERENATVTVVHRKTRDMARFTRTADIIIVAAGHAKLLTCDMVKPNAVIIDVGVNRTADGKLCGDVDFDAISAHASLITPVPGGIGPLTIAFLLCNIVSAYEMQMK